MPMKGLAIFWRCFSFVALLLWAGTESARAEGFITGLGDIPLMDGLGEVAGGGMVFDTPAGRIAEAYAAGNVSRDAVLAFYAAALPQLGWSPEGAAAYRREGELLRLEFTGGGGTPSVTVRFSLSPQAKNQ